MPPVDGGSLQVQTPEGWTTSTEGSEALVSMNPDESGYPTIFIIASESGRKILVKNFTKSNVKAEAERLAATLKAEGVELTRSVNPVKIDMRDFDPVYVLRYSLSGAAEDSETKFDRLILLFAQGGRRYQVELRALQGTLEEYRNALYAVAGSMRVVIEKKR